MSAEEMDQLTAALRAMAGGQRSVEAPARVEERLVRAFRECQSVGRRPPRRAWWFPMAAWATAAAAGCALAVFLTRDHPPARVHQSHSAVQLAVADSVDPDSLSAGDSGFIPLPNAESFSPTDEVDVVRVEVPRSAIVALGLPVSEELATETVKADIALGPDGLARAVRILEE